MRALWKENDGFRLLVWVFVAFFAIASVWMVIEKMSDWKCMPELFFC